MQARLGKSLPPPRRTKLPPYRPTARPEATKVPKGRPSARKILDKALDRLLLVGLVFLLIYAFFVRSQPRLSVNSEAYHPLSSYQGVADEFVSGLTYRTKLTYNQKALVSGLEKQFPEIESVSVQLPLLSQRVGVHINVSAQGFLLDSASQSYLLDNNGKIVAKVTSAPKDLVIIKDQSGLPAVVGQQIISPDNVSFMKQVVVQSRQAKVPLAYIVLPAAPQEFDLYTADKAYYTKFYFGGNALLQSGQFVAARHYFDQSHQDPAYYLDVRVAGKIFYK